MSESDETSNSEITEEQLKSLFPSRHGRPGDVFMETLKRDGLIAAPGVYDAMGGHIAKKIYEELAAVGLPCTFNAVYEGHWSTSAMLLRKPDMGFVSKYFDFIMTNAQFTVSEAYPLPLIFDIETGFGDAVGLPLVVQRCDNAGIAIMHLEDQEDPRRCGNLIGKWCAEPSDVINKIRSCLITIGHFGSSLRLMVRTDALTAANGGFNEAVERGKRYMSVEVNGLRPTILWADAMYRPDHIDNWINEFRKFDPNIILGINYSPNRDWTPHVYKQKFGQLPPTYQDLYKNGKGFSIIWHTILQARSDMESTWNTFYDMAQNGAEALWRLQNRQRYHPVGDAQAMSGVKEAQAFEKWLGGDSTIERYEKSEGYKGDNK